MFCVELLGTKICRLNSRYSKCIDKQRRAPAGHILQNCRAGPTAGSRVDKDLQS